MAEETKTIEKEDVFPKMQKFIADHLGVDVEKVTLGARFKEDLGADSLDTVELVMGFEEEFRIEIPEAAAEKITTVGEAVKSIEEHSKT